MSKENINLFFEKINQDQELQSKLNNILTSNMSKDEKKAKFLELAEENNCEFTEDDIQELEGSLSDEDLENVTGGLNSRFAAGILGTLTMAGFLTSAASSLGASAFDAQAHSDVAIVAMQESLEEDSQDMAEKASEEAMSTKNKVFSKEFMNTVLGNVNTPDNDEIDHMFAAHFFNPETGRNFLDPEKNKDENDEYNSVILKAYGISSPDELEKLSKDNALSRTMKHFNNAVNLYTMGKIEKAGEELGRCLHFAADLNTPVHTHNESMMTAAQNAFNDTGTSQGIEKIFKTKAITTSGEHQAFERVCDTVTTHLELYSTNEFNDLEVPETIGDYTIENYMIECAKKSNSIYSRLKEKVPNIASEEDAPGIDIVKQAAAMTVKNARTALKVLINKFHDEIKNSSVQAEVDEQTAVQDVQVKEDEQTAVQDVQAIDVAGRLKKNLSSLKLNYNDITELSSTTDENGHPLIYSKSSNTTLAEIEKDIHILINNGDFMKLQEVCNKINKGQSGILTYVNGTFKNYFAWESKTNSNDKKLFTYNFFGKDTLEQVTKGLHRNIAVDDENLSNEVLTAIAVKQIFDNVIDNTTDYKTKDFVNHASRTVINLNAGDINTSDYEIEVN